MQAVQLYREFGVDHKIGAVFSMENFTGWYGWGSEVCINKGHYQSFTGKGVLARKLKHSDKNGTCVCRQLQFSFTAQGSSCFFIEWGFWNIKGEQQPLYVFPMNIADLLLFCFLFMFHALNRIPRENCRVTSQSLKRNGSSIGVCLSAICIC